MTLLRLRPHIAVLLLTLACPAVSEAHQTLDDALRLERSGHFDQAREKYRELHTLDPNNQSALIGLAMLELRHFSQTDTAIDLLEYAVRSWADSASYHFLLAEAFTEKASEKGLFSQLFLVGRIRRHLEQALELDPRTIAHYEGMIQFYMFAPGIVGGSKKKARAIADEIPDSYMRTLAHAGIHLINKDIQQAENLFLEAIAHHPERWEGHFRLGEHYHGQKRYVDATGQFRSWTQLTPLDPDAHYALGKSLMWIPDNEGALAAFEQALSHNPVHARSLYLKAILLEREGQPDEALRLFREVERVAPVGATRSAAHERVLALTTDTAHQ